MSTVDSVVEPYHSAAAETVDGEELTAVIGLQRFIIHTEQQINQDWQHFFQEGISDVPAFALSASAIQEIMNLQVTSSAPSIVMDNAGNFASAFCATLLMYGLQQQKGWAREDLKKALRLYIDYRDDRNSMGMKEANKRLEAKMLLSGLQYTGLPDNIKHTDFDKHHAIELAKSFGVFSASEPHASRFKHRVQNVSRFLTEPGKLTKTMNGLDGVYTRSARFFGDLGGGLVENTLLSPKIVFWDATNGVVDSVRLSVSENKRKRMKSQIGKDARNGNLGVEHEDKSPLLHVVQHKMDLLTEEQKLEVQTGLQHLRTLRRQAHATRRFLVLQIGYMTGQGAQGILNGISDDPHRQQEAYINIFGVMAAMGPLSGFSKHLKGSLQKIESQRAHEIERIAHIMGMVGENENTPAPEPEENQLHA